MTFQGYRSQRLHRRHLFLSFVAFFGGALLEVFSHLHRKYHSLSFVPLKTPLFTRSRTMPIKLPW